MHPLSENAQTILKDRYLQLGETPDALFHRVANAVAAAEPKAPEYWAEQFYNLMSSLRWLVNSPCLVNAGVPGRGCLAACFTCSPDDHMESILQVQKDWGMIEKWGGGVGMGLSRIRPKGDAIQTTHGKAIGPVGIMRIYAANSDEITQGSFRRGAHMGQLLCTHPDVQEFIHCKDDDGVRLSSFNISVQLTDEFMKAKDTDTDWQLINPRDGKVWKTVKARELWDEICESAWKTGDPGVVFMDRVWEQQPNPQLGAVLGSNPCSEQFLEEYGNCALGSFNLSKYVKDEKMDLEALQKDVVLATRFLDDVIEVNQFPIAKLREVNLATRRIGLGVMGWADVLAMLRVPYDSQQALELAELLSKTITETAWQASQELARERGPFPEWERSALRKRFDKPVRNSCVTSIAPTGTLSRIASCSSGIEPYFALAWWSNVLWEDQKGKSKKLLDAPAPLKEILANQNKSINVMEVLKSLANASQGDRARIAKEWNLDLSIFQTANELSASAHVAMQAAWQKHVTNGVSKTINLASTATIEDVASAYQQAWGLGCKSVTVYRDGSKSMQVLETGATKRARTKERPRRVAGVTEKIQTGHGNLYTTVNFDPQGKPFEVFSTLGKAGSCNAAHLEAVSRLASLALRSGVGVKRIVDELQGLTCCPVWDNGTQVLSPVDAIAHVLKDHGEAPADIDGATKPSSKASTFQGCPNCGEALRRQEGCTSCGACGWERCQ